MRNGLPVLLLATLLLATPAAALEKCLTGGSTLGDQRALAALRADIDAACPCASYDGGKGADRAAYRRCARTVRDQALAARELRTECRANATRGFSDTTCGTIGKVACGRVQPSSKTKPVGCSVKSADRCASTPRFTETACTAQTHCSDVVDWTAGTCNDVRARSPYQAGVRTITFTKQSAVNPANPRPLDTVIWYPTDPGAGPINSTYGAVVDAPLAAGGAPYPVVLFSHGSCGFPLQSIFLTAQLAAQGFVVVAPPHPGNTINEFPTCGTSGAQVNSFIERPQDIIFVLDEMLAANDDAASPFFGALDPDRIAMSGHSFGGLTTYLVQAIEPRVKVAIPMAPAVIGTRSLTVPSLTMIGAIDTVVNNAATQTAYAASDAPKTLVSIGNAGHYAFSGLCFPSSDCNPPTTLTQDEAHGHVLRWVRPFLETYLNGDASYAAFFLRPLPGETVSAQLE
jgi:predicted dienelactone hydrolase